jgi:predicted CoA-binding protein
MLKFRSWAVVGDVLNATKPASRVVARLRANGKSVQLVNPKSAGCYSSLKVTRPAHRCAQNAAAIELQDCTLPIEVVNIIVNPKQVLRRPFVGTWLLAIGRSGCAVQGLLTIEEIIQLGIQNVWIQPGAESPAILERCRSAGIHVHEGCVLKELSQPSSL